MSEAEIKPTTNADRRERARSALRAYVENRGEVYEESSTECADLIADLLHLTAEIDEGFEPIDSTIRVARMHFDAEHGNPEEE